MSIEILQNIENEKLIIWGAVAYFILAISYGYLYYRKVQKWPYVVGRLQHSFVSYEIHGSTLGNVRYEYEVAGKKYIGKRISPMVVMGAGGLIEKQLGKVEYVSEDQVKVFYNPKKPKKSYLIKTCW